MSAQSEKQSLHIIFEKSPRIALFLGLTLGSLVISVVICVIPSIFWGFFPYVYFPVLIIYLGVFRLVSNLLYIRRLTLDTAQFTLEERKDPGKCGQIMCLPKEIVVRSVISLETVECIPRKVTCCASKTGYQLQLKFSSQEPWTVRFVFSSELEANHVMQQLYDLTLSARTEIREADEATRQELRERGLETDRTTTKQNLLQPRSPLQETMNPVAVSDISPQNNWYEPEYEGEIQEQNPG
ncbi:hypothetical protein BLNAU_8375 [Blattamonas nauphoetae]|uniref:Uncharacterized protein n=1 Tax=Blattamonas nauphoetae TaxID=2049346 RepID=A0ABQ9XZ37_9EUKA|nr:hypothetical protein BLNAU_8375 [Blattamonas nauphoetae]